MPLARPLTRTPQPMKTSRPILEDTFHPKALNSIASIWGDQMDPDTTQQGEHPPEVHHHKQRHIAEKLESYVVMAMAIVGAILLVALIYYFMQTGTSTPSWMK
jgi:hypothetical protein